MNFFLVNYLPIVFLGSWVIYALGQKGEQLDRARADMHALSDAVADLASAQASAAVADAKDKSSIEDIKRRLDALERVIEALRVR